jgi:hypothetical protein
MKKIIAIIIIVAIAAVGGYFVWKSLSKPKATQVMQEFSDTGFKVAEGNYSLSAQYIGDPLKADYGIAVYPSAKPITDKQAAGNVDINGKKLLVATFTSPDSVSQVVTFYQKQMGSQAVTGDVDSGTITYKVIKNKNDTGPVVSVYTKDNTTYFTIVKLLN